MVDDSGISTLDDDCSDEQICSTLEAALSEEVALVDNGSPAAIALLNRLHVFSRQPAPLCQLLAELAKQPAARQLLSESAELFGKLAAWLSCAAAVRLHACRALGNLCFDCPAGRLALLPHAGSIGDLVVQLSSKSAVCAVDVDDQSEQSALLRHVVSGTVLNLTNSCQEALQWAVESAVVERLVAMAVRYPGERTLAKHVLIVAGFVCDCDSEQLRASLLNTRVASLLRATLTAAVEGKGDQDDAGVLQEAVEFAAEWCRSGDDAKLAMATSGVCISLCRLMPVKRCQELRGQVGDVLVEVLGCDEAMTALYVKGQGDVYAAVVDWLKTPPSAVSATTEEAEHGSLEAVGLCCAANFASNDDHALAMVSAGVHDLLLPHLSSCDWRCVSGALVALRNLSVPHRNQHLLREPTLQRLLQLSLSTMPPPVLFKYYAVLRLLTDSAGRTADRLLNTDGLLQLVAVHALPDSSCGVHYEARRLLARLARTAGACDQQLVSRLATCTDAVRAITLLTSESSALMVNEALVALCLLVPHLSVQAIERAAVVDALLAVRDNDSVPDEAKQNVSSLVRVLRMKQDESLDRKLAELSILSDNT